MNALMESILRELLKDVEFWEPVREGRMVTGYKLKLSRVLEQINVAKEALFYDRVLFPRTQRIMRLIKKMDIGHLAWQEQEVGINQVFVIWYPVSVEWQDYLSDRFSFYFQSIWTGEEWEYQEPTEAEVLALGVRPATLQAVQERLL